MIPGCAEEFTRATWSLEDCFLGTRSSFLAQKADEAAQRMLAQIVLLLPISLYVTDSLPSVSRAKLVDC
jgi:hypothetical protein